MDVIISISEENSEQREITEIQSYNLRVDMNRCFLLFFDNEYQKQVKKCAISDDGFEYTLQNYRDLFLKDIAKLEEANISSNCDHCSTCHIYNPISNKFKSYLNEFCNGIRSKSELITILFNEVIHIYISALSTSRSTAMKELDDYLSNRCNGFSTQDPFFFSRPYFRVRETGEYDGSDIHELFHVPFNKRQRIANMRFSLTGVPLLYLAESIPLALKEINCKNNKYNAAIFLPKYSNFCKSSLFDMTIPFVDNVNAIQGLIDAGCNLSYNCQYNYLYTEYNIDSFLARFILSQCLHFTVQNKDSFVPEYLLPQLLMDVISEKDWIGIRYQSCKDTDNESRDRYLHFIDDNICFKVPYSSTKYNEKMLNNYYYATWCNGEKTRTYSELEKIIKEFEKIKSEATKKGYIMTDFASFQVYVESHITKMFDVIGKKAYLNRKSCRVEITLFYKLFEQLMPIIMEPEKNGIHKIQHE